MPEVPWWPNIPDAKLHWDENATIGYLYFKSPEPGNPNHCVPVTTGPTRGRETGHPSPVWHIEPIMHNRIVTVSPSIHAPWSFHSPNPVQFRITEITRGKA
jgi:hypothetical protein